LRSLLATKMKMTPTRNKIYLSVPGSIERLALADVKESMKKELKELEAKLKALREAMERYDVFQQDDEIGLALAEVEAELDQFRFR